MKSTALQHIQTRLFLHAVLPTLDAVIKASPKAQALLKDNHFSVCFKTRSGLSASYFFTTGGCEYIPGGSTSAGIELLFLTDGQAAATFLEQKTFPPLPTKGFSALGKMKTFVALTLEMQAWLKPDAAKLAGEQFRQIFVPMTLGLALRAVAQLCRSERRFREQLAAGPQGLAAFQLGKDGEPVWLRLVTNELTCGQGEPADTPDVRVIFHDSVLAAEALQDKADALTAVGNGAIEVLGLVPLADHLNAMMERVQGYIDPPAKQ
ncbi:hypothetical protein [Cerasicoccus arenae]|uniref:SCP2 domain-containing protein n=1 Tax=Cerasicoccus arenae TaxID=424488 RepID=A0A8J3DEN2_9BACT|nr:hypothetical protein [Cerasicoccus arenae]MBK1857807.1 hypothetical protein [Cerasicoccus arenae]GHC11756.1 hypothetical protein GCM10007047_31360 [Cerasicoccus arenae]